MIYLDLPQISFDSLPKHSVSFMQVEENEKGKLGADFKFLLEYLQIII